MSPTSQPKQQQDQAHQQPQLSIVVISWNDLKVLPACLRSIRDETREVSYEVILSDNGSTDGTVEWVRQHFPDVKVVESGANLGYARGNNAGIRHAAGRYVLILNPDTIIHDLALDKWVTIADGHPEAGAFGCRVLNPDGSFQEPARPFPTILHYWLVALKLRPNSYWPWKGESERCVDWQSGCCVMFRGELLKRLGGFDERFFYHFEEVDLCRRVRDAGFKVLYSPEVVITHLGGQSVGRFPIRFELEKYRNRYRYFHKHFGERGLRRCRTVSLAHLAVRRAGYGLLGLFRKDDAHRNRMEMLRVAWDWNRRLDPLAFIQRGAEPESGYEPLSPAPAVAV